MSAEKLFLDELETFRKEAESASQFFYAYLAIHEVAKHNGKVFVYLNRNALLWNTVAGALQMSALVAVHRILNHRSRHNLDSVLRIAEQHASIIFSMQALRNRKRGSATKEPEWLDAYIGNAYVPRKADFRRIRSLAEKYKKLYEANYAGLRNKVYAHMVAGDPSEVQKLTARTNTREMERMFVFLLKVHETLQELFYNGRKPILRGRPYSARRMRHSSSPVSGSDVHVRIAKEVESVLLQAAADENAATEGRRAAVVILEQAAGG